MEYLTVKCDGCNAQCTIRLRIMQGETVGNTVKIKWVKCGFQKFNIINGDE